ncbi:hypothetical protein ACG0Z5_23625 [Scandinavium sp. M-37]|uniref:hypothetical protein n=1 Tax=Scandinavium sp. M-37 TaxID=3373077 RepID=UPI0037472BEE
MRHIAKLIFIFLLFTNVAYATLQFQTQALEDGTFVLIVDGAISSGDAQLFARKINSFRQDNTPLAEVWLNSPGGVVDDALTMSLIISENHLTTAVPNRWRCVSACVLLFGAGAHRYAMPESIIGVHRISINATDTDFARSLSLDMDKIYTEMNFPENVKYKMLTTPPSDVYYLTFQDKQNISVRYSNAQQVNASYSRAGISSPSVVITRGDRTEARELNQKAILQIRSGQYYLAIQNLEAAKSIYPSDAEVLGNLGYAYYMSNNLSAAQMNLTSSLQIAPQRGSSWNNLGLVLASTNQIEWATKCFIKYWNYSSNKRMATNQFFSWEQQRPGSGIDIASKQARAALGLNAPVPSR